MNKNPEGTPNPLSQGSVVPGQAVSEVPAQPAQQTQPAQSTQSVQQATKAEPVAPMPGKVVEAVVSAPVKPVVPVAPVKPGQPTTPEQPVMPAPIGSASQPAGATNPMASDSPVVQAAEAIETMETVADNPTFKESNDSVVKPEKKSSGKVVAIVLAIILVLVGVGAAVAIMILKPFGGQDAVPAAMEKLMNGAPDFVTMSGTISTASSGSSMMFPNINVSFTAGLDNKNNQSYADATIKADLGMSQDFTFVASEVHTSDGNLYLKLSGVADALTEYAGVFGGSYTDTSSVMAALGLLQVIDNEWIMIPDSTFSSVSGVVDIDETTQCLIGAAGNLGQYGSSFAKMYKDNPFINYSTDNITVAKKKDTIYKLTFDAQKLAGFINAMGNSGFMNEINACTGAVATNMSVSADNLTSALAEVPAIYVEIDDNDNFTRVYFVAEGEQYASCDEATGLGSASQLCTTSATVTVDISFSYPSSITVTAPESSIPISTLLSQILGQFYGTDVVDITEVWSEI